MKKCLLLVETEFCPKEQTEDLLFVHWDGWELPVGHLSLVRLLQENLETIRTEHAQWAWEFGHLQIEGRELQDWLRCGETLSMWWCSLVYERHPKMTPNLYVLYKLRTLELLLRNEHCVSLQLIGGDATLARTLQTECELLGLAFEWSNPSTDKFKTHSTGFLRTLYKLCPITLRAILRFVHWLWTVYRLLPKHAKFTEHNTATVATYFPNVDTKLAEAGRLRSRYWESLHDVLNAQATREGKHFVRWLFIRFPSPQFNFRQCLALTQRFNQLGKDGLSFDYLEAFLTFTDLSKVFRRFLSLRKSSIQLEEKIRPAFHFANSALNFWAYVAEDWRESFQGWRCLERCLQNQACQNYVQEAGVQRWTLFPLENCPWERMLTFAVHSAGNGVVYGAQHSVIRPADLRYFDDPRTFSSADTALFQPDAICANGLSALKQWQIAKVPPQRLKQLEALRYLYLPTQHFNKPLQTDTKRLLVVTSFFRDETLAHLRLLARAIYAGLLQDWQITLKAHPYCPVKPYLAKFLGHKATSVFVVEDGAMSVYLQEATAVWASNSTTAALEAAVQGLPVLVMQPLRDFDLCPLRDLPGLARTGSLQDVRQALQNLQAVTVPVGYLNLKTDLSAYRQLLGLSHGVKEDD